MDDLFDLLDNEDLLEEKEKDQQKAEKPNLLSQLKVENDLKNSSSSPPVSTKQSLSSKLSQQSSQTKTTNTQQSNPIKQQCLTIVSSKPKSPTNKAYFQPKVDSKTKEDLEANTGLHIRNRLMAPHIEKFVILCFEKRKEKNQLSKFFQKTLRSTLNLLFFSIFYKKDLIKNNINLFL